VRLLLDTHIALWAIADDPKLPEKARVLIGNPENNVNISAASVWEIAIKHSLARPNAMPISGKQALKYFRAAGYEMLPVTVEHAAAVERLRPRHTDPFDRLLIAQALSEPLTLLTHDKQMAAYNEAIVLV
jgi:PIN domain nuclease of toxin-antitoxin system